MAALPSTDGDKVVAPHRAADVSRPGAHSMERYVLQPVQTIRPRMPQTNQVRPRVERQLCLAGRGGRVARHRRPWHAGPIDSWRPHDHGHQHRYRRPRVVSFAIAVVGYVKDGNGLINLYRQDPPVQFTTAQYTLYRDTIEAIRRAIMHEFQLTTLYFTAPTFLTRLIGNASWTPAELHDEHAHVDKNNTHHYDYSGLLYLADYGVEFTGGMFAFLDHHRNTTVEPARGRLMMFTSGAENVHEVRPVESGARYLMSMWFTCDARKRFHNFLDGKVHEHYASAT
ncbi:hypothetical protein, variant 3 [Aphanomyces invadans]|uniref:Prolyl 4-hydroxylase alpha subunit domain-containing protein n=1 Tax=Aphanomyces invadans TaxID=157072 RepID=A0A024TJI1_9STRA|nr:hypothetical protein, variant 3 [Aphanomyces invadans]ETV93482.1 hypothetical protein, variant 3 [Aphanomyces invadans]|eukprot:XP_008877824.1 hypothetical protein, variant 3 [Aphanomyces invadans]